MKPRVFKGFVRAVLGLGAAASLAVSSAQTDGKDATPASAASSTKTETAPKTKKPKPPKDTGDPTLPPKIRKPKDIPFPVPVGRDANRLRVPSYDQLGKLLSVIEAAKATRVDDEHVQMDSMVFGTNGSDGKEDYRVEMPTSVLNLKTNVITSDHPVVVRTRDFELTGEKMEFNTVDHTGELQGHVHMRIHNLKQVALPGATPAP